MPSQIDLDQGGTIRTYMNLWQGPSLGWLTYPVQSVLPIFAGGTYDIDIGTNAILIDVAANVTIQLPSALANPAGAGAVPGSYVAKTIAIGDLGGNATSFTYNILPYGSELISGLTEVPLAAAYGWIILQPNVAEGGWTMKQ